MGDSNLTSPRPGNDAKLPWSTPRLRNLSVEEAERIAPGWAKQLHRHMPDMAATLHELRPGEAERIARLFARGD